MRGRKISADTTATHDYPLVSSIGDGTPPSKPAGAPLLLPLDRHAPPPRTILRWFGQHRHHFAFALAATVAATAALSLPVAGSAQLPLLAPPHRGLYLLGLCAFFCTFIAFYLPRLGEFFLFCADAHRGALRLETTERWRYVGYGATIFLTAVLASLSGGYALQTVFHDPHLSIGFGALWGAIVFNLDRQIVSGMRRQTHWMKDLLLTLPRVALAVLIAIVVSKPLELRLLDGRIERQVAEQRNLDLLRQRELIEQGYAKSIQERRILVKEKYAALTEVRERRDGLRDRAEQEFAGRGPTSQKGDGPAYKSLIGAARAADKELADKRAELAPLIAADEQAIQRLEDEKGKRLAPLENAHRSPNDFVDRIEALAVLSAQKPVIRHTSQLIFTILLVLELAPVLLKLMGNFSGSHGYEKALKEVERRDAARLMLERARLEAEAREGNELERLRMEERRLEMGLHRARIQIKAEEASLLLEDRRLHLEREQLRANVQHRCEVEAIQRTASDSRDGK